MSLHTINPADMPPGRQPTIDAGDLVFEAAGGPDSQPDVVDLPTGRALRCDATVAYMWDTSPTTLGGIDVTIAMIVNVGEFAASALWAHSDAVVVGPPIVAPTGLKVTVWDQSTEVELPPGIHALVATANATRTLVVVDGSVVDELPPPGVAPAGGYSYLHSTSGADLYLVRLWDEAVTDQEAIDLSTALAPPGLTGAGGWGLTGVGVVSTELPVPVDIPDPPSGGSVDPPAPPTPQAPPAGVPDPVIRRISEIMPAPPTNSTGDWNTPGGVRADWQPTTVIDDPYGRIQVVVEGTDITYLWGAPIPTPQWSRVEPFGSAAAQLEVPQITPFHQLPSWCAPGANVDIRIAKVTGGIVHLFAGVVTTFGHRADSGVFTVECAGVMFVDDLQLRQPAFLTQPRDIGRVVADALNSTVSRRHSKITPVVTGCLTGVLGGWEPKVTGYVQQLLATAVKGGRQWTVKCDVRAPQIAMKDTTTIGWTVTNGQRGITVDLTQDWSKAPNVLFASGIGPDGGRWQNAKYPNWRPDDTPLFPMGPSQYMSVGTTDAHTTTGRGVSDWQAKVGLPVTGRYGLADRARCFQVQRDAGIQQDGTVGPQTWAATFGTGANTGTLECFYLPVAFSRKVMPRRYGPNGEDRGPNPAYDPDVLRVEDKIDFGQGVTKTEGVRASEEILARDANPGWVGTVAFELDPEERSKFEVKEGSNGRIKAFRGGTVDVHVARVDYAEDQVVATVDTNARDYPTLAAIRERERNATDPAKSRVRRLTRGQVGVDRATFDAESPAGHLPRHALFPNLWVVVRVPFGAYGSIVRTEMRTTSSPRAFSMAVFDRPVTAARLLNLVGNPLTASSNPWSENGEALDEAGLLMAWGWAKQPMGYWPRDHTNPDGDTGATVTGKFVDDASWDYATRQVPWVWVATIASGGCYVQGRFWPGVDT